MADRNRSSDSPTRDESLDNDAPGGTSGTADEAGKTPTPSEQDKGSPSADESAAATDDGSTTGNGG